MKKILDNIFAVLISAELIILSFAGPIFVGIILCYLPFLMIAAILSLFIPSVSSWPRFPVIVVGTVVGIILDIHLFWGDTIKQALRTNTRSKRTPISNAQKKCCMRKTPLLILCGILFVVITAVLSVGAHYAGMKAGYSEGYNSGKDDGYTDGYNDGLYDGYKKGYNAGFDDGRAAVDLEVPYDRGYEDGYNDAINGY